MTATLNIPARRAGASDATVELPGADHPEWMQRQTPCKNYPDLWFASADDGRPIKEVRADTAQAKWLCVNHCPVWKQCQEYALARVEAGVWGGLTERERREIRAARRLTQ